MDNVEIKHLGGVWKGTKDEVERFGIKMIPYDNYKGYEEIKYYLLKDGTELITGIYE